MLAFASTDAWDLLEVTTWDFSVQLIPCGVARDDAPSIRQQFSDCIDGFMIA